MGSFRALRDMGKQMRKILVALLISGLVTPAAGFAQTAASDRTEAIRIPALQFPAGILREAVNRESIRLAALPPAVRQQQPRTRSWPGRHPVLFGALVGLGAGLGIEAAVIPGASGGEPHSAYLPMFACLGAGIGSLAGVIVSVARR
jgi:hypothetical protein